MKPFFTKKRLLSLAAVLLGLVILLGSLPHAREKMVAQVGYRLGMKVEIAEIGGNGLSHLTIGSLQGVRRNSLQPVAEFAATDVRLDYSLLSLFHGLDAFLAQLRISASHAHLVLDPAEKKEPAAPPAAGGGGGIALPAVLPLLAVKDMDLTIRAPGYDVTAADGSLHVGPAAAGQPGQPVAVDIASLQLRAGGQKKLETSCRIRLLYAADRIRVEEMSAPDKLASLQGEVGWGKAGNPADFFLHAEVGGGRLQGSGSFAAGQTDLKVQLDDMDIAELARLFHFKDFAVAGRLSGSVASRLHPAQAGLPAIDMELNLSNGELFGKKTEGRLQGGIKGSIFLVSQFAANYGGNRVEISGGTAPLTLFTGWDMARLADVTISSFTLRLRDVPGLMAALGMAASVPAVPPGHALVAQGSMANKVLTVDKADFKTEKNSATLSAARLQLAPAGQSFFDSPMAGSLRFHINDMHELSSLFALPAMAGEALGEADISGTLRKPVGRITLKGDRLAYDRCTLGDVTVEARADTEQIRVLSLALRNDADRLQAEGSYSLAHGRVEKINGQLSIKDLARYADSCLFPGRAAGTVEADISTTEQGEQQLHVVMNQAHLGNFPIARLQADLTTDWRNFTFSGATIKTREAVLDFSGRATLQREKKVVTAQLDTLAVSRENTAFALEKPVSGVFSYGAGMTLEVEKLVLHGGKSTIAMQGRLARDEESSFRVEAENLSSRGWLASLTGSQYHFSGADLALDVKGPLTAPTASLSATVAEVVCPQLVVPLGADVALDYSGKGVQIRQLQLFTANKQKISLQGLVPYDPLRENGFLPDPISVTGRIELPDLQGVRVEAPLKEMVAGEFTGEFELRGTWEQPRGRMRIKGSDLFLSQFIKDAPREALAIDGEILLQSGDLLVRKFTLAASSLSMNVQGKWSGIPSVADLVRQPPAKLPGTVALDGQLEMNEVGWLTAYAGGLRRLAGHLQATVGMRGPAARPQFNGGLSLTKGSIRLADSTLPTLEKLELQAALNNNVVRLQKFTGVFGGAPFGVNGTLFMTGADAPVIHCRLQGKDLLLYRDDSLKIRADADLTLQGPWRRLELGGKVNIVDGRYTRNVDFLSLFRGSARPKNDLGMRLFTLTESPWKDMVFDVQITSAEPFPVYNNMAKGAVRPNLRLTGTGEIPELVGRVFVDPTRVTVPAGRITIESGVITFPEHDPDRPTFDMSGNSRLAGYDITLLFQGTSDEPTITLSSDPPLSDDELLLLVLTGRPPISAQDKGKRAMANMNTAVYLGRGLLSKWFGGDVSESEESMLDRFEFDFGRQLSKTGEETAEAQFRLLEGMLLPGDRLFLTSEKDVYDNFNVGVKIVFRFR